MALDSIAKLSVIITGDESPLARATKRAESSINSFSAIGRATGPIGLLKSLAGAAGFGGVAGAVAVATSQLIGFTVAATRAAIDGEAAAAKANRQWSETEKKIRTTAGQLEIFRNHTIAPVKNSLGEVLAKDLGQVVAMLNVATGATQRFKVETEAAARSEVAAMNGRIEQLRKWASEAHGRKPAGQLEKGDAEELRFLENKKRMADYQKESDKSVYESQLRAGMLMEERANQIRTLLMTPLETYNAKLQELQELVNQGMLSTQFFERAAEKAKADMEDAATAKDQSQNSTPRSVAAAERFTLAGHTAVAEAQARQRADAEQIKIAQSQLSEEQQMRQLLQKIDVTLRDHPSYQFIFGSLN